MLPTLGVSVSKRFSMNTVCVPRRGGEAAGAITKLAATDGDASKDLVINVEYNQLEPLLLSATGKGDENDASTGYSPFPGNSNVLVLGLKDYVTTLDGKDEGVVDEFVNPKYKDEAKCAFKKPTRLESARPRGILGDGVAATPRAPRGWSEGARRRRGRHADGPTGAAT